MNSKTFIINGHLIKEKLEKDAVSCGKLSHKIYEEKSTYSNKYEEHSYASTSTDYSQDEKSDKTPNCFGLFCVGVALAVCISGCYIMWGTDYYSLLVQQNVVLTNNSRRYEAWKSPPVNAFLRVYIFNYTNVDKFEQMIDKKLKIEELGPYTYEEKLERVDIKFNKNGTITYRDKKSYTFSAKHSRGNESDIVNIPNLPYLAAMNILANLNPFLKWPLIQFLKSMNAEPFLPLNVSSFLWGYEDRMSALTQKVLSLKYDLPFKKFGILSAKNQTQKDLVTMYTGEDDPSKLGIVVSYNGKDSLDLWHSKECNRMDGTDGTLYPPAMVHPNSTLFIYLKDLCRKMPLVYSKSYHDKHGISVLRYRMPKYAFASGHTHKDNYCFCSREKNPPNCLPSGIFNVAPCTFGAPIATSLPHFLYGDPILNKGIEGLQPNVKRHESYVEVDEKLGIPVGGKSRVQLNIMLSREFGSYTKNRIYQNQTIFPFAWMDYGVDRLPDDISFMIRSLLSLIKMSEFALSYGFIVCSIILAITFTRNWQKVLKHKFYSDNIGKSIGETPLVVIQEKQ